MITAIVLAAGQSRRMGQPKINLPWGKTTVLGQVLGVLALAGVAEMLVVTGEVVPQAQPGWEAFAVRWATNPQPGQGDMLRSLQIGLQQVGPETQAVLVVLADQPQMQVETVGRLLKAFEGDPEALIIPSFAMRRGHPWLLPRRLFAEVAALAEPATLRDFLNQHQAQIVYLAVDSESVLQDLDTPEDYKKYQDIGYRDDP